MNKGNQWNLLSLTTALATEAPLKLLAYLQFSCLISYILPQPFLRIENTMQVGMCWGFNWICFANLIMDEIWASSPWATYSPTLLKALKSKYIPISFCMSPSQLSIKFLFRLFTTKKSWRMDRFPFGMCKGERSTTCNGDPLANCNLTSFFYKSSVDRKDS